MYWLPAILIVPYIILLLWIFRSLLLIKPFKLTNDSKIFVSVVVACRNEQENLPQLLKCVTSQNYPENLFEIIIVNDHSADQTFSTASQFRGKKNVIVLYKFQK